ncbi:hypothetical protein WN943_024945 [Citrus x changshan-huyou]
MLSDARLRLNRNEYDRFNKKSQPLNLSSELKFLLLIATATSSTHGVISEPFVEAAVFVGIWISDRDSRDAITSRSNELSSRLGRILAAIMGTNGDSVRKIPARHKGIVKMKKIPARQKGLVFQNKQIVLLALTQLLGVNLDGSGQQKNIMITAASGDVLGSAVGFAVFTIVLLSWALTFAIEGEHLFGSAWDKLVMYNVAERLGLTGWS